MKQYTEQDIIKLMQLQQNIMDPVSLNAIVCPNGSDGIDETELGEFIPDPGPTPEDVAVQTSNRELLMKYISKLSPREQAVLIYRFGFADEEPMTLEQIGDKFGVSRERIRQVEKKALTKMRRYITRAGMSASDF